MKCYTCNTEKPDAVGTGSGHTGIFHCDDCRFKEDFNDRVNVVARMRVWDTLTKKDRTYRGDFGSTHLGSIEQFTGQPYTSSHMIKKIVEKGSVELIQRYIDGHISLRGAHKEVHKPRRENTPEQIQAIDTLKNAVRLIQDMKFDSNFDTRWYDTMRLEELLKEVSNTVGAGDAQYIENEYIEIFTFQHDNIRKVVLEIEQLAMNYPDIMYDEVVLNYVTHEGDSDEDEYFLKVKENPQIQKDLNKTESFWYTDTEVTLEERLMEMNNILTIGYGDTPYLDTSVVRLVDEFFGEERKEYHKNKASIKEFEKPNK